MKSLGFKQCSKHVLYRSVLKEENIVVILPLLLIRPTKLAKYNFNFDHWLHGEYLRPLKFSLILKKLINGII